MSKQESVPESKGTYSLKRMDAIDGRIKRRYTGFGDKEVMDSNKNWLTNQTRKHKFSEKISMRKRYHESVNLLSRLKRVQTEELLEPMLYNQTLMNNTNQIERINKPADVSEIVPLQVPLHRSLTRRFKRKLMPGETITVHPANNLNELNVPDGHTLEIIKYLGAGAGASRIYKVVPVGHKPNVVDVAEVHEDETNRCGTIVYDPCTGNPIPGNDIELLEQRVKEIKANESTKFNEVKKFPKEIVTRLDLLLYVLNRGKLPDESLLEFTNNGQLYESYWDIVFAFNLIDDFPKTPDFYLFGGKIETLVNIESDSNFSQSPISYLKSHLIMEGSSRGASDITFVYKHHKHIPKTDTCLADSDISPTDSCRESKKEKKTESDTRPLFYFCSSKYYKSDGKKGIDKFDIQNIYTAAKELITQYDKRIILLVRDREAVEGKIRKAIRKYISEEASYVFGIKDMIANLTKLYTYVRSITSEPITEKTIRTIFNEEKMKPLLNLRLHQHMAVDKITNAIHAFKTAKIKEDNKFLVGIVPRGGKTYIAGGIINELKPRRVVVLLGAKSETLVQFKDDLFEAFANFNDYTCIDVVNEDIRINIDPSKKYIFIMSVELYKDQNSKRELLKQLKGGDLMADLFICDEAHLKQTTKKATDAVAVGTEVEVAKPEQEEEDTDEKEQDKQLKVINESINKSIPIVYMTGTYRKPMSVFKISSQHSIIWEYEDIQQAKDILLNDGYFRETFGEIYTNALDKCLKNNESIETISSVYRKFPELQLITTQFTKDAKDSFLLQNERLGFPTLSHLFEVRKSFNPNTESPDNWYTGFTNFKGMARLINYLTPTNTIQQLGDENVYDVAAPIASSALQSVDSIAQRMGDRLAFFTSEFIAHTQLWFLPKMQGHALYKRMTALAGIIFQSSWFRKHFHVLAVSSSVKWAIPGSENNRIKVQVGDSCGVFSWACPGSKSLKECILDEEAYARSKGKGLIILAQNMLHLGISLPCVDIVVLLDNGDNMDERIQKMYRALTESSNKKAGYIIDMNYFRTVRAIIEYQLTIHKARTGKDIQLFKGDTFLNDLFFKTLNIYSIDIDKPIYLPNDEMKKGNSEIEKVTIPELQKMYSGKHADGDFKIEEAAKVLNSNINAVMSDEYVQEFDKYLKDYIEDQETKKNKVRDEGENVEKASRGANKDKNVGAKPAIPDFVVGKAKEDRRKSYVDIFKTTLKLGAFGTDSRDVQSLIEKLNDYKELREVVYDTLVKRSVAIDFPKSSVYTKDEFLDMFFNTVVIPGLKHIIDQKKNISYSKMKEGFEDESKYPKHVQEVLVYIRDHLAPKEAERHKYGEVFTPMDLVNEMLDTLPSKGKENVWNNADLKWLDPANGMGNYPIAVFLRLYYGFRTSKDKYIGITNTGEGEYNPGLTKVIPDDAKRCTHIVKNMLFMVEINPKNIAISKRLFKKLAPDVDANIIQMHRTEGFLADIDMKFPNGTVNEFDIIMGNPPFNRGGIRRPDTRKNKKDNLYKDEKKETIWNKFILQSVKRLKRGGYLLFIHPIGWFHSGIYNDVREILLNNQIHNIRIYYKTQSASKFGGRGAISVAYYLMENKPTYANTIIKGTNGENEELRLNSNSIITLNNSAIFNKILSKLSFVWGNNKNFKHDSVPCVPGEHKQIAGIYDDNTIKVVKTNKKHSHADDQKIIISGIHYPRVFFDKDGKYGLSGTGVNYWIGSPIELKKINQFLKTKLAAFMMKELRYRQDFVEFKYMPDITKLDIDEINDATLSKEFGFTSEERKLINSTDYPENDYRIVELSCDDIKIRGSKDANKANKTRKIKRRPSF